MSWNPNAPFMPTDQTNPFSFAGWGIPQNALGASGVTLGNPEAQRNYAQELAQAMAQRQRGMQQSELAASMMQPEYADGSGALGSLAMVAQALAGRKIAKRADESLADALERELRAKSDQEYADAQRKARTDAEAATAQQARRAENADEYELTGRDRSRYILTGEISPEGHATPMMTSRGLVMVNQDGTYRDATPEGAGAPPGGGTSPQITRESMDADVAIANELARGGVDPAKIDAWLTMRGQRGSVGGQQQAQQQPPQQAQPQSAPPSFEPLMPYKDPAEEARQAAAETRANATLAIAQRGADRADATEARQLSAQQSADRERSEATERRITASNRASQDVIDAIDSLTGMEGYGSLGTFTGNIAGQVPLIPNDVKDARAKLGVIRNQVVLSAMAQLKALSAQGATGFGSLSAPELKTLQDSIDAIADSELSHKALDANLQNIRRIMERAITPQQAPATPASINPDDQALIDRYIRP